jgi:hypothetical protein
MRHPLGFSMLPRKHSVSAGQSRSRGRGSSIGTAFTRQLTAEGFNRHCTLSDCPCGLYILIASVPKVHTSLDDDPIPITHALQSISLLTSRTRAGMFPQCKSCKCFVHKAPHVINNRDGANANWQFAEKTPMKQGFQKQETNRKTIGGGYKQRGYENRKKRLDHGIWRRLKLHFFCAPVAC